MRAAALQSAIGLPPGGKTLGGLPYERIIDRALQSLKKDGVIRYSAKGWVLVGKVKP